ncbi:hypothetical protein TSUD_339950 [Trifolium subterraneum]|nr:hypothetical protein TSUD_339950 [Trifolium subterraneum]
MNTVIPWNAGKSKDMESWIENQKRTLYKVQQLETEQYNNTIYAYMIVYLTDGIWKLEISSI